MNYLQQFAQCKALVERELRLVAVANGSSRPKRIKSQMEGKIENFERNMITLKRKWDHFIENLIHRINDREIYDKLASDLTESFIRISDRCVFEGDQLDYAMRCFMIPISGQLMDESRQGWEAYMSQENRCYLLMKMLSSEPTVVTITALDVLFEAVNKHSSLSHNDRTFKQRIFNVVNISYIVDTLAKYLDTVIEQLDTGPEQAVCSAESLVVLEDPMNRYETQLQSCLNSLENSTTVTYFRRQVDMLLFRVKLIKSRLER